MSRRTIASRGTGVAAAVAATLALSAVVLSLMGRVAWCACGQVSPFAWDIWSRHMSQHLIDPYSFSHVQHGLVFFVVLLWLLPRWRPLGRLALALGIESGWEILENTPLVIERYREATVSLDYFGDSVINSLADILCCAGGYGLAAALPAWATAVLFAGIEVAMLAWIRDSLLVNVWMLIAPSETLRHWQIGALPPGRGPLP